MTEQLTLKQVLEMAIQKEIESQHLYMELSGMVNNNSARDALQKLVQQEKGHQRRLEKYLRGEFKEGGLSSSHVVDYKIAEGLGKFKASPDMDLKDTFHLAADREKMSHEFYSNVARIHPEGEIKRLFEELAEQELEHKQRVELLYTQVAYPQTDGG